MKLYKLLILLTMMALIPFRSHGKDKTEVDFNFPQDVSKNAIADLNAALKGGDGQMVVDALVRYGIAQSGISQENMPAIVSRIDSAIAVEKRPEIKSLLYYLEAEVFDAYRENYDRHDRVNPDEEKKPDDYTEWDDKQFRDKMDELVRQSLSQPEALKKVAITSMPNIISADEMGALYVPTLFEFLSMKGCKITADSKQEASIVADWKQSVQGNLPATIYVDTEHSGAKSYADIYRQYSDNMHSGYPLSMSWGEENYEAYKDYVKRFPNEYYTPAIIAKINSIESKSVSLKTAEKVTSSERLAVDLFVQNVNDFDVLVYRVPDNFYSNHTIKRNRLSVSDLQLERTIPVHYDGTIPFRVNNDTLQLDPLPHGQYYIAARYKAGGKTIGVDNVSSYDLLTVSDIMLFLVSEDRNVPGSVDRVMAVDATTGKPLSGVKIIGKDKSGTTGPDGSWVITDKLLYDTFYASLGSDQYGPGIRYDKHQAGNRGDVSAQVFTDLGVYRPGETVKWALVLYETEVNTRELVAGEKLHVRFTDTNGKEVATCDGTTDDFGRMEGTFEIPTDRMNGNFELSVNRGEAGDYDWLASQRVTVSEYKTPTFEVTFPEAKFSYVKGSTVKITGKVETYSGMPVPNAEVKVQLYQKEWSWWWRYSTRDEGNVLNDTIVTTDAAGCFTVEYPAKLFKENNDNYGYRWAHYNYKLKAACTDGAGETQEGGHSFIVGERSGIELANHLITYVNTKPLKLPLTYNTTREDVTSMMCEWELTPRGSKDVLAQGTFPSDNPELDLTKQPSGEYLLTVRIQGTTDDDDDDESENEVVASLVLYRPSDKQAPVKDANMWIPENDAYRVDGNNVAHITIGTSVPEAHIYYVAQSRRRILNEGWLHYKPGMHDFTIAIPKESEEFVSIEFISGYKKKISTKSMRIDAPAYKQELKLKVASFRDRLVPGDHEHWTIQFTDKDGRPRQGALMLEMFDKAIASIQPNEWSFWVPLTAPSLFYARAMSFSGTNGFTRSWSADNPRQKSFRLPSLNFYGQEFFEYLSYGHRLYKSAAAPMMAMGGRAAGVAVEESVMLADYEDASAVEINEVVAVNADAKAEKPAALDNIKLREADVKTALWMPMLTSDEQGNVSIEFDAPEFNTTWLLQAIGFDKGLYTDRLKREVVTQKPIMVKSNMPRFLRHGDVVNLAANVQNATEQATKATAVIELFDPRTSTVYDSRTMQVQLAAKGSQAVSIPWTVPSDIPFVGFRIKAANDTYGDGEQVMVPVLEAISPVIETQPFYIEAGAQQFTAQLPQFASDARVTLEYCDNPVWYCATALPTLLTDNYDISTSLAHSLFAIEVAQAVVKRQPQIRDAVDYWKAHEQDSTLVSMLAKNQDLKIGALLASPWLRDADRQTLRMSKLHELFDAQLMAKERSKILDALQKMQMPDGGWPWFVHPQCRSSLWTTHTVLELIGEIQQLGQLTDNATVKSMTEKAIKYFDQEYLTIYKEQKNKKDYSAFTSYVYVRTLFKDIKMGRENQKLFDNTLKQMSKDWRKGLSLSEKAYFAMTLNRNGYQKTAATIMESVRQFAIVKPELGMYWDNLQSGWRYFDKVAVTATIMQAFNECDPRQQELDQMRKWMLLMKQTNDWGSYSLAADAVYTILTTGSQWLGRNSLPTITIGDQPVVFDKVDEYLGYCRKTIPATSGATISISRNGNSPAWGAIYNQFNAPMTAIPEVAITELSINKEFYRYNTDGTLSPVTEFKVGDKVQVRLVIKNNKDLDYVTVKDERAACFEPVDKLSGYRRADYSWYYLETKDALTNIFFTDLQKGTHVINYDVYVMANGQFSAGIATAQCQYAPQITAHSAGRSVTIK